MWLCCAVQLTTVLGLRTYPSGYAVAKMTMLSVFARGCLEALCQLRILPSVVVTNDWFAGLVPAYARNGFFGTTFAGTKFIHIVHNLDPSYEGRQYPDVREPPRLCCAPTGGHGLTPVV